jgi:hypothetical protein
MILPVVRESLYILAKSVVPLLQIVPTYTLLEPSETTPDARSQLLGARSQFISHITVPFVVWRAWIFVFAGLPQLVPAKKMTELSESASLRQVSEGKL